MKLRLVIAAIALSAASPLAAQTIDYAERARDLETLAGIFGELHHIRRMCEPRSEGEIWRERMRKLIELEDPQPALRDRMVSAFNSGFYGAEKQYPYCDRDARDHAASIATQGDAVTAKLMAPLYKSLGETGALPNVQRGASEPQ
ncbi:MAG TPA: TIGR02301 family protein [Amphiplicatus sp.]|nr:TIGR02301 family protein [Caulobacterales bacterium]HOP18822.1 TIGR02301 family protein [Amphiplicatus sp.]HRX37935.1 TIGR02301 family protein [Parvularculaceae bacterium]